MDHLGFPGLVGGPSGKFWSERWTPGEVRDGSGDPREDLGRVGNIGEFRDGSGDPRGVLGRVGGLSGSSRTGWGTIGEVRDRLGDPRGVSGRV